MLIGFLGRRDHNRTVWREPSHYFWLLGVALSQRLRNKSEAVQNLSNEVHDLLLRTTRDHPSSPEAKLSQNFGKKKFGAGYTLVFVETNKNE